MANGVAAAVAGEDGGVAVTDSQLQEAAKYQAERPCIDAALKNFLSLKLATGLVSSASDALAAGVARSSGSGGSAAASATSSAAASAAVQGCARALLRAINRLVLPPSTEWSRLHPQRDEEIGGDFMQRIGTYKVVQALWGQCTKAGQKPARLLGRSAFAVVLPEVEAELFRDLAGALASAGGASEEQLRAFVAEFASTASGASAAGAAGASASAPAAPAAPTAAAAADGAAGGETGSDAELVWAENFGAVLAARQAARRAEAAERQERATSADDFAAQLRAAVGGAGAGASSGPIVEEVHEEDEEAKA